MKRSHYEKTIEEHPSAEVFKNGEWPASDLLAERDRLRAVNAELAAALDRCLALVSKGAAEGAYKNIVAGPEYAERVFQKARSLLAKVQSSPTEKEEHAIRHAKALHESAATRKGLKEVQS